MTNPNPNTVILRDVTEADLPIFYEQQLDPVASQMAAFPSRDRDAFMAHWKNKVMVNENGTVKAIVFDGHVAGNIVSWEQSGQREVGYWLGKEFWGKGIATKALAEFLGYVKTRPLVAHVAKHNIGSLHVLQKCGFVISGEDKFTEESGIEIEEIILTLK
jgi:RimJ/RimL family protein N-acetyltransferase